MTGLGHLYGVGREQGGVAAPPNRPLNPKAHAVDPGIAGPRGTNHACTAVKIQESA